MRRIAELTLVLLAAVAFVAITAATAAAVEEPTTTTTTSTTVAPLVEVPDVEPVPDVAITVDSSSGALSQTVTIIILLTVAAVAPGILLLMTSFPRFAIVMGLTRNALGVQTIPPSQVLIGLSLILTVFVMGPIFGTVNERAVQPMLAGELAQSDALAAGYEPLREFMLAQTREDDLRLFMGMAPGVQPATAEEVSATVLVPAFVVSELRTAFIIGFIIFVPFLVIDLIVAAVLMSMGMVMLPPVFISLPLKLLVFVMVDGWSLIVGSVVESVRMVG